jgi:chemotaxis protein CheD
MSGLNEFASLPRSTRRINVIEGDFHVSGRDGDVLCTILGSCVAVCLYDVVARIGGMNHFLLAEPTSGDRQDPLVLERFGAFAMEQLINEMQKMGARRETTRAHIYGGGMLRAGMERIGAGNRAFARNFLERDRIAISHEDVGGNYARRVEFRAASGQARCRIIPMTEITPARPAKPNVPTLGDVELF